MTWAWDELKKGGSAHYKTASTECIDLYRSGDMFHDFALASIIKYAFRSRREENIDTATLVKNLDKIIHYAELLKASVEDKTVANVKTLE
jgi:hypothetical protein